MEDQSVLIPGYAWEAFKGTVEREHPALELRQVRDDEWALEVRA